MAEGLPVRSIIETLEEGIQDEGVDEQEEGSEDEDEGAEDELCHFDCTHTTSCLP